MSITEQEYNEILRRRGNLRAVSPQLLAEAVAEPKRCKFGSKRTEVDGIVFASKREATRYQDLKVMLRQGLIHDLKLQVTYPLVVNGQKVASYRSDFDYIEKGNKVVEDTKGCQTPMYRLKKKLMRAIYGIDIRET